MDAAAHCALDGTGLRDQGARYSRLARSVACSERTPHVLTVDFDPGVDRSLLDETLAIERDCCPFFALTVEFHAGKPRLRASVADAEHAPALDALAAALGAPERDR